jgi:DNA-binding HxlR family transcriptional regulator
MSIYLLEGARGSLEVLIYLYLYGPTTKTNLCRKLKPSFESLSRVLRLLKELHLVSSLEEQRFPYRHEYQLTSIGRKLVESPLHRWPGLFWDWSGEGLTINDKDVPAPLPNLP